MSSAIRISNPDHQVPESIGLIIDRPTGLTSQPPHSGEQKSPLSMIPTVPWIHYWLVLAGSSPDKLMYAIKWITWHMVSSLTRSDAGEIEAQHWLTHSTLTHSRKKRLANISPPLCDQKEAPMRLLLWEKFKHLSKNSDNSFTNLAKIS